MSLPLWVPPSVSRELREKREQHRNEIVQAAIRDKTLDVLTAELKKLDPDLELIKAKDDAEAPGLKPGYWHVMRNNHDAPPSLLPIVGDDGEYVEPTYRLLDWLRAGDLQNARAMEARREFDERAERRRQRAREAETEDRLTEIAERWKAVSETQVSMNRDTAWGQNAKGAAVQRANKKQAV